MRRPTGRNDQDHRDRSARFNGSAGAAGRAVLNTKFRQPVVVEHRPAPAAQSARSAKAPRGSSLLLGNTSTPAVIPAVSISAGYDPVKNFYARGMFVGDSGHRRSPLRAVDIVTQFLEYAKASGQLNWAHSGPGSFPHLAMEVFMMRTATKMTGSPIAAAASR
jgi:tripartite-type tricarboxylate transporter receptor subunit TctC